MTVKVVYEFLVLFKKELELINGYGAFRLYNLQISTSDAVSKN